MSRTTLTEFVLWLAGPLCAAFLVPLDNSFVDNFLFTWVPQAAILGLLTFFRAHQAVRLGVACTLAVLPVSIYIAFRFLDGDWWRTYILLWPGALIGSALAPIWSPRVAKLTHLGTPFAAAATLIVLLGLNVAGIGVTLGW